MKCQHSETLHQTHSDLLGKAGNFALYRRDLADRWRDKVYNVAQKDLKKQYKEAAELLDRGLGAIKSELIPKWKRRSRMQRVPVYMQIAAEGFNNIEGKQVDLEQTVNPVAENPLDDDLLAARVRPPVEEYVDKITEVERAGTLSKVEDVVREGREEQLTIDQIARNLSRSASSLAKPRANTISRTSTIWANNEGSVLGYKDQGVPYVIWRVTEDDRTCAFCLAQDGDKVRTGKTFHKEGDTVIGTDGSEFQTAFPVGHPPLHPNCRCVILPGFE